MSTFAPQPVLLLTRPDRQSHRFAAEFRARFGADWPVVIAPLSRLELLSPDLPLDGAGGLIFTSETAVAAFVRISPRRDLPAYCVGPRTAAAARAAGFAVSAGPGEAEGLIRTILAAPRRGRLLYIRGRHVAADLARRLTSAGIETIDCIAYDQVALPLSPEARRLLQGADPVLLPAFSARGAQALVHAMPPDHAPLLFAAISPAVLAAGRGLTPWREGLAPSPDAAGMLAALAGLIGA